MERLWAPWRMEYILNSTPAECIFCRDEQKEHDRDNLVLARAPFSLLMLNRYPYNNGHLLVAPHRHVAALDLLTGEELVDLFGLVSRSCNVLNSIAGSQGFNIGINIGKAAGAGVEDHLHVHIVPRWNGDTNFMSVLADLRVMPENLQATYDSLLAGFAEKHQFPV